MRPGLTFFTGFARILKHSAAACLVIAAFCVLQNAPAAPGLEEGFKDPPREARPLAWWHWINGNITKEGIEADLADMKRVGIGGVQLLDVSIYLPAGPVRYGSDLWHEHVQHAIRVADKLGLEFHIMNCPGWSASGGPWNTPEGSMKQFTWSEVTVQGGREMDVQLPRPPSRLEFYRDAALVAVPSGSKSTAPAQHLKTVPPLTAPTPYKLDVNAKPLSAAEVLVLTPSMSGDGHFRGRLPGGEWTLLRFGFTTTGAKNHPAVDEGHGLECDKMNAAAAAFQFEHALGRILREAGPLAGKTFRGILFDSFEAGLQNWTDAMPELFSNQNGYDLTQFLPVLTGRVVESVPRSQRFLREFRGTISQSIAREYFGTMQRLAHEHGLAVYAEAQGGPLNPFLCNEYVDVPMNEFWMPDAAPRFTNLKHVSSIASLRGLPITAAEAFTAKPEDGRWLAIPSTLKLPGDTAFAAGINRFVLHTYVHQPFTWAAPGFTLGRYGTHFGRLNTWWPFAGEWLSYVSRSQFLLQQGRTVADICFLSDELVGPFMPSGSLQVPEGYDYQVCYPHHLAGMRFADERLVHTNGAVYKLLVLPQHGLLSPQLARHVESLARAGAHVIGAKPYAKLSAAEAVATYGIEPDFTHSAEPADTPVRYTHRTTGEADIYFIANQAPHSAVIQASFGVSNRTPEIWDPLTGKIADAWSYGIAGGRTRMPLRLPRYGSIFVVFRHPLTGRRVNSIRAQGNTVPNGLALPGTPEGTVTLPGGQKIEIGYSSGETATRVLGLVPNTVELTGPWQLEFQPGRVAPEKMELPQLVSWSTHPGPGVRHFSGTGSYTRRFQCLGLEPGVRCVLSLGQICDVAEVKVNNAIAGTLWTAPMEVDITGLLKVGTNLLQITVANRWANRLIGDEALSPDLTYATDGSKFTIGRLLELPAWLSNPRLFKARERKAFATWHLYEKDSPLLPSGLLGPVKLRYARSVTIGNSLQQ